MNAHADYPRPRLKWTPEMEERFTELWNGGIAIAAICSEFDVSAHSVNGKANSLNLVRRKSEEWPDEDVADITRLWAEGRSASQIGLVMHKTRNAIIGKARRLHLPARRDGYGRISEAARADRSAARKEYKKSWSATNRAANGAAPCRRVVRPVPTVPWEGSLNLGLLDLGWRQCRFPFGDGPFLFCGRETPEGQSYCDHCYRVAHHNVAVAGPPTRRGRRLIWAAGSLPNVKTDCMG